MKIGILTHPQGVNYGGIMQCWALYTYLTGQGHDCVVIHKAPNPPSFFMLWKGRFSRLFGFKTIQRQPNVDKTKNIRPFVSSQLKHTRQYGPNEDLSQVCRDYNLDAVFVGSDQVWRKDFAMNYGYNYFLDFADDNTKKIAYAASFGLSQWLYTPEQTEIIKKLIKRFNSVSVREEEGVELCQKYLGIKAEHVLDPTLLLNKEEYVKICSPRLVDNDYIFVYWLGDPDAMKKEIAPVLQETTKKTVIINLRDNIEHVAVEDWLSYIRYADCVLTDSFHGCALSVVFNRPLKVFSNVSGGQGRIKSLFANLGIEGNEIGLEDYLSVNERLIKMIEHSINHINTSLK